MFARPTKSHRRLTLSVLAAAATLALSGCAGLHPGTAAVVGPTTITHDRVDGVALALCSANMTGAEARGEEVPVLATRGARQGAMQVLLDSELSKQFGEKTGVEPNKQAISEALAQNEEGVLLLPESQREDFREALRGYAAGQLILIQIGRTSLEDQGETNVADDQAGAEGQRLRGLFAANVDVEVDPRYGTFEENTLRAGGSALSVAVSDSARAGENPDPAPDFVSGLPSSQRCS